MKQTFFVSVDIDAAANLIDRAVVDKSITGQCIDTYTLDSESSQCRVMVYEKHFLRVSNRLTLTVVIDNFDGKTRVHCVSGGGGDALRFDWGASDRFAGVVEKALSAYII